MKLSLSSLSFLRYFISCDYKEVKGVEDETADKIYGIINDWHDISCDVYGDDVQRCFK